jgi:hypothetical protein
LQKRQLAIEELELQLKTTKEEVEAMADFTGVSLRDVVRLTEVMKARVDGLYTHKVE